SARPSRSCGRPPPRAPARLQGLQNLRRPAVAAYATPAQWAASDYALATMPADPEAQRRLNRAIRIIDAMIITAIYDVDDDGLPTDTKIADALRDATCAQAEFMASAGDPLGIGATNQISSFS